jgi:hypothetical protein
MSDLDTALLRDIAATLKRLERKLDKVLGIPHDDPDLTFTAPKRYLQGETLPLPEGDWQLYNDGHEGEDTV